MANFFALQVVRRARPIFSPHLLSLGKISRSLRCVSVCRKSQSSCFCFTGKSTFTQQFRCCSFGRDLDEPTNEEGVSGLEDIVQPEDHEEIRTGDSHDDTQYMPEEAPEVAEEAYPDEGSGTSPSSTTSTNSMLKLEPCHSPPSRFSNNFSVGTKVYSWHTTAKYGRRLIGPMMEWAQEFTYRTGVSVQWDTTYPEKLYVPPSGTPDIQTTESVSNSWYSHRDEVEVTVYFFGSQRAIDASVSLMEEMIAQEPVLVRVGIFKKQENGAPPHWLALRRVNNETRPADIPAISLKTPGKFTLLFETHKEAAVRSVFEETGIRLGEDAITPTGFLDSMPPEYYWRSKVYYFVAELPPDAEILGPRTSISDYFVDWDSNILRQSPDPIDRVWANYADPKTGTAWLTAAKMDELQLPLKGENYMETRYKVGEHLPELREATQI